METGGDRVPLHVREFVVIPLRSGSFCRSWVRTSEVPGAETSWRRARSGPACTVRDPLVVSARLRPQRCPGFGSFHLTNPVTFLNLGRIEVEDEGERAVEDLLALHLWRKILNATLLFDAIEFNQLFPLQTQCSPNCPCLWLELWLAVGTHPSRKRPVGQPETVLCQALQYLITPSARVACTPAGAANMS